jgi:hypothetical protein
VAGIVVTSSHRNTQSQLWQRPHDCQTGQRPHRHESEAKGAESGSRCSHKTQGRQLWKLASHVINGGEQEVPIHLL